MGWSVTESLSHPLVNRAGAAWHSTATALTLARGKWECLHRTAGCDTTCHSSGFACEEMYNVLSIGSPPAAILHALKRAFWWPCHGTVKPPSPL